MGSSKKQISISTNLSNDQIIYNYEDYKESIICRYTNSNYNTLINPTFTTFLESANNNNDDFDLVNINNYYSKFAFDVNYILVNKEPKRLHDLIFNNCTTLYAINNLPESIKTIGKYAFNGCTSLKYLKLPKNVTDIREFAFNGTHNLKSFDISNVKYLHNYSFAGSGIESIELNKEITVLYHYLFKDCKNLKRFVNNDIHLVGEGVFCGCTNLEYVELSKFEEVYEEKSEYIESLDEIEQSEFDIGKVYDIYMYNAAGNIEFGTGTIETIENLSSDDFLKRLIRLVINDCSYDTEEVGNTYYVLLKCLTDESGETKYQLYDEDGMAVNISIMLRTESEEPEVIEVSSWALYDCNDNQIGNITEELANYIKEYDNNHNNEIIEARDLGNGTEIIQFKNPIEFVEYYIDGVTQTGNIFDDPTILQLNDETQYIKKYKYFSLVDGQDIIQLTDDLNINIVFNSDFTQAYIKLNCYPVYEATQTYIAYYMFEPFLSIRKEYDEDFVEKEDSNGNIYVDNGFIVKYVGTTAYYPVYNVNYCYLGRLNNGEWLDYTNQSDLDRLLSKINAVFINDSDYQYFMLLEQNYSQSNIDEENVETTIEEVRTIINEIIEYHTGEAPEEGEEELPTYSKFDLSKLSYSLSKIDLPNSLFAGCINLDNNNIVKGGNYNKDNSHVNIVFSNQKASGNFYSGTWKDTIHLLNYKPSTIVYNYEFKWKYLTLMKIKYINIILNNKNYYISETFDQKTSTYIRKLVDNIYDTPTFEDKFVSNTLTNTESIFDIDIFNKNYLLTLENYQYSIYDKYCLLDSILNIGNNTFMNCASIKSIYNKFENIGDYAFKDCINLKSIPLNKCITIGKYAFQNCKSLTEVSLNYLMLNENDGIFYNCENLYKVNNFNLSEISKQLFKNCTSLNDIKLNQITKVNDEAFYNCESLEINTINNEKNIKNITYFGDYSFYNCKNIKSIEFNENIEYFGKGVFKNCSNITEVNLPENIVNFTDELFCGCKNLKKVIFNGKINDEIKLSGIDFCNNTEFIYIPNGGRYITPNNTFIFDTLTNTIVYVCKQVAILDIKSQYEDINIGTEINISNNAFNNCNVSIINISQDITTPNVNMNTFKGILNDTYHILINKNDTKYDTYYQLVGRNHIYYV